MSPDCAAGQHHDIIGYIHGCAPELKSLLAELGYEPDSAGVYRHPDRTAVFVGAPRRPRRRELPTATSQLRPTGLLEPFTTGVSPRRGLSES